MRHPIVRKAGEHPALKSLLKPWYRYDRKPGDPTWIGRTEHDWKQENNALRGRIIKALNQGLAPEEAANQLVRNYGYKLDEAEATIRDINNPVMRQELKDVPHAVADEAVSTAILANAGFQPVKVGNTTNSFATDLVGTIDGQELLIDAQRRIGKSGNLNISAVLNDREIIPRIMDAPDELVKDVIARRQAELYPDNYRRYMDGNPNQMWYGQEGKLLDSQDWATMPNPNLARDPDSFEKDLLISNHTPTMTYDKQLGIDTAVYDLEVLRNMILNKTLNQVRAQGIQPMIRNRDGSRKNGLTFAVPPKVLKQVVEHPAALGRLPEQTVKDFTRPV